MKHGGKSKPGRYVGGALAPESYPLREAATAMTGDENGSSSKKEFNSSELSVHQLATINYLIVLERRYGQPIF